MREAEGFLKVCCLCFFWGGGGAGAIQDDFIEGGLLGEKGVGGNRRDGDKWIYLK